jgi:TolA-binding protein
MRREMLAACIVAACMGVGAGAARGQQVDGAQQVLDSARRAYNEGKFPFAADRFREFVKANPNHKELAGAELGLGAALLEAAEPDYAGAVEALTVAAGKQDYEQHGQALYYLGMALKGQAGQMADRAKGAVKLEEAAGRLAEATAVLEKQSEKVKVAAGA